MNNIVIKNVTKTIKGNEILKGVLAEFHSSKIHGIIGRNGSGKSVLLKVITRMYTHDSGDILFNNVKVNKFGDFPFSVRAFLEKPSFIHTLSGYDNLRLLSRLTVETDDVSISNAISTVNLSNDKDKAYGKYSFGMKQKLGIACTIMDNPDTIILDEPFNGIDEDSCRQIREYLIRMKQEGKLIIIATHIKDDIQGLCDIVFEMKNGRLNKVK